MLKLLDKVRRAIMGRSYTEWTGGFSCCLCDEPLADCDQFSACPAHWDRVVGIMRDCREERIMEREVEFA